MSCWSDGDGGPPPPSDAEVLRNIEVLAAFVAKHGPSFEQLALQQTSGDPNFSFLLPTASPERAFYLWKKSRLQRHIFSSDGSDDLQLKICMMVDDPLPSSTGSPSAREKSLKAIVEKPSGVDAVAEGSRRETSKDYTNRKVDHLSHRSRSNDQQKQTARIDQRMQSQPANAHKSSQRMQPQPANVDHRTGSVADDLAKKSHQPPNASTGDSKRTSAILVETKELTLAQADFKDSAQHQSSDSMKLDTVAVTQCEAKVGPEVVHSDGTRGKKDAEMDLQVSDMSEKQAKEAYGLKLLKAALADYVKEVLKPAWKEGNMSKDSFKAIVKKVVDKVCGSLQGHQIPKTQENVDQYMQQSQSKIAKLVQGYVEKFKKT